MTSTQLWRLFNIVISLSLLAFVVWMAEPTRLVERMGYFSVPTLLTLSALLLLNLLAALFRFWRILMHFRLPVSWRTSVAASMSGNLAGLLVVPLLGQVAGRQVVLQRAGIPPAVNASLAAYERAVVALSSGAMAFGGATTLFGSRLVSQFVDSLALGEVATVAMMGGGLSVLLARGRFERRLAQGALTFQNILRFGEILGLGLLGQLLMLGAFVMGFHAIAPQISIAVLFSASAVISFAASMPISVGGWGVRELTAVYVMGQLGVPPADALAVSVLIGVLSTLVVIGMGPFAIDKNQNHEAERLMSTDKIYRASDLERSAAWVLGFSVAVAVFFQVHVTLPGGTINVNLADPLAMLALAAVGLHCLFSRSLPAWRVREFNVILLAMAGMLLMGFINGWTKIGVTQWALGGKLFGGLVLLGYASAGYLIASRFGSHGLRRWVETLVAVACSVIVVQIMLRTLAVWQGEQITANFEGYAGNRNAFAFQLLTVVSLLLGYSCLYARKRLAGWLLGILLLGIFLTSSRAAIGVAAILLAAGVFSPLAHRRVLVFGVAIALVAWGAMEIAPLIRIGVLPALTFLKAVGSPFSSEANDLWRWRANYEAIKMWLDSPLIGGGLGVFLVEKAKVFGFPIIIHSTPLWILAEFGLVGLAVLGWAAYALVRYLVIRKAWKSSPAARALVLLLLAFAAFCQLHEVLYQRIFWLALGALLAVPSSARALKSDTSV
jgi:uncharacterized membrane protein YbhN (UPF0104 family)